MIGPFLGLTKVTVGPSDRARVVSISNTRICKCCFHSSLGSQFLLLPMSLAHGLGSHLQSLVDTTAQCVLALDILMVMGFLCLCLCLFVGNSSSVSSHVCGVM